jgi:hypothetical protein
MNWRRLAFMLALASCIQFIVLTVAGMFFYPGGTRAEPGTTGYSFWSNFFSDLGRTATYSGDSNTVSMSLFVTALSLAAMAFALTFVAMPRLFAGHRTAGKLALVGSIFGVVSAISYLGIACVPSDIHLTLHRLFVYAAFSSFLLVVILYSAAIFRNRDYPNLYAFAYLGFALILTAYLWLLFGGPHAESPTGVRIQATGQKIVVYAEIVCMSIQACGALRTEKRLHLRHSPDSPAEPSKQPQ